MWQPDQTTRTQRVIELSLSRSFATSVADTVDPAPAPKVLRASRVLDDAVERDVLAYDDRSIGGSSGGRSSRRLTPELTCGRVKQESRAERAQSSSIYFNTILLATFDERDYIITG